MADDACAYAVIVSGKAQGKGVLVTAIWEVAAAEIRAKVEAGADVTVRRVAT